MINVSALQMKAIELRNAGWTYQRIANKVGRHVSTVWKWLERGPHAGVKRTKPVYLKIDKQAAVPSASPASCAKSLLEHIQSEITRYQFIAKELKSLISDEVLK